MYQELIKPALFAFDPERAHRLGMIAARQISRMYLRQMIKRPEFPKWLETETPFGKLCSPLGLAAGFDKNAENLIAWEALGFSFAEIGTVTPRPQPGNPKPRIFRLSPHFALINRLGFNNEGAQNAADNIKKARERGLSIPVGGNIGKNFDTAIEDAAKDYRSAAQTLVDLVDYLVVNVSSPNTPGLRDLQNEESLTRIMESVREVAPQKPLFVKLAPDEHELYIDGVRNVIRAFKLAGVICGNTLANKDLAKDINKAEAKLLPQGGLSGRPLRDVNLQLVRSYADLDPNLFIIGVGGISTGDDISRYLRNGAKVCQAYTGFIYEGPRFAVQVVRDFERIVDQNR